MLACSWSQHDSLHAQVQPCESILTLSQAWFESLIFHWVSSSNPCDGEYLLHSHHDCDYRSDLVTIEDMHMACSFDPHYGDISFSSQILLHICENDTIHLRIYDPQFPILCCHLLFRTVIFSFLACFLLHASALSSILIMPHRVAIVVYILTNEFKHLCMDLSLQNSALLYWRWKSSILWGIHINIDKEEAGRDIHFIDGGSLSQNGQQHSVIHGSTCYFYSWLDIY